MRGCPVITVWDRVVASAYMRLCVLAHLFLERGQYVSGLKGHKYDLDSCMSVHLLKNCPLLDSLKPMEQAFPSITLTPVSENWKGDQCCYSESVQFKLGRKTSSKLIAVQGLYANGN